MIKVNFEGKDVFLSRPTRVIDLIEDKDDLSIICCLVNNVTQRLDFELRHNSKVELLRLDNHYACNTYYNSLRYLFAMATHNLYPHLSVKFSYSISQGSLIRTINSDIKFNEKMRKEIDNEMHRLVESKLDINVSKMANNDAVSIFEKLEYKDKIDILKYRPEKTVYMYTCNEYMNYVYGKIVTNTKYLDKFELTMYEKGILLRYPRAEEKGNIPNLIIENTYQNTLNKAYKWARMISAETIADINSHVTNYYDKVNFVHVCEARHNQDLVDIAEQISDKIDDIKLIAIAGPSSSGKTTFSNRLRIQLMTLGINPVKLSIDDYYLPRDKVKPGKDGKVDLEDINIIDIELFNKDLNDLLNGKKVTLPVFDFKTGTRKVGQSFQIKPNQPIIIEGIHALNDLLTVSIPRANKYKIYIGPHVQVNIDNLSPIQSTDLRMLRRIVRDNKYRGYSAETTISLWDNVRRGEFKWIYPNEEGADYVYNSDLIYEVNVLKKHALPLLKKIEEDSPQYNKALHLIKFLKYYEDIEDDLVPCNSLLREFIGGSCFKDC